MGKSLVDYSTDHPPARPTVSWLTTIPEHDEIVTAWGDGVDVTTIHRWLVEEQGYPPETATAARIGTYLRRKYPR